VWILQLSIYLVLLLYITPLCHVIEFLLYASFSETVYSYIEFYVAFIHYNIKWKLFHQSSIKGKKLLIAVTLVIRFFNIYIFATSNISATIMCIALGCSWVLLHVHSNPMCDFSWFVSSFNKTNFSHHVPFLDEVWIFLDLMMMIMKRRPTGYCDVHTIRPWSSLSHQDTHASPLTRSQKWFNKCELLNFRFQLRTSATGYGPWFWFLLSSSDYWITGFVCHLCCRMSP